MKMKRSSLIGLVSVLAVILLQPILGCTAKDKGDSNNPGLEVIMELSQEHYNNMGFESTASPIAYRIEMFVTNTSNKDIKYSRVLSGFIPPNGRTLQLKTTLFLDGTDTEATATRPFILKPGATEDYNFTTNGYTMDLLIDANKEPLVFVMILLRGEDEVVYKTPSIELPPINDLPSYELSHFKNDVKPLRIKLTP